MNILFLFSENSTNSIVRNQGKSLEALGLSIDYLPLIGKGLKGYLNNIPKLRYQLDQKNYDIIHAHYSLTGILASIAGANPLIVSLMGSDIKINSMINLIIKIFANYFWKATIVKSKAMKKTLGLNQVIVLPNGIDLSKFRMIEKIDAKEKVSFDFKKKYILFLANPNRVSKNFPLAENAIKSLNAKNIELKTLTGIDHDLIPFYLNASDVLILTSLWEGSPNVIKEAMACNLPIVATDVGDVRELLSNTEGCHITSFEPKDVAEKINQTLKFRKPTNGRDKIKHLDEKKIAEKLFSIYRKILA